MDVLVLLTFFVGLAASIVSGLSGGGAGFIIMPYYIFIGMSPAQALATAKMGGIGTSIGAISAFKGKGLVRKKLVLPFIVITIACAIVSAWLIPKIDPLLFQKAIGCILIVLIPTLFINKAAFQPGERSSRLIVLGYIAYIIFAFMSALVGTGMGSILVLVLMFLFGLSALEANATKRVAQAAQSLILFILLLMQGLVVVAHGIAGILGAVIGTYIGTKIAIKKGNKFVKIVLAITMLVSGVILIFVS